MHLFPVQTIKVYPFLKVEFQFDFGSPNAYLATCVPGIEKRTGVKFEYVPVLLGGIFKVTNNMSPFELAARDQEQAGISARRRPSASSAATTSRPSSRIRFSRQHADADARRCRRAAREGVFEPYFRAAYHHMWEEPKKMDDPKIFREALISSGLDIDRLIARSQEDDVKNRLIEVTTDAVNRGAFGSPTFFVGDEMFFGKDQLRDVEEEIVAQIGGASCLIQPDRPAQDLASERCRQVALEPIARRPAR